MVKNRMKYYIGAFIVAAAEMGLLYMCLAPCQHRIQEARTTSFASLNSSPPPRSAPRFLWGIMTTLGPNDVVQRDVLRRTYLNYDPERICPLSELEKKPSCQLAYTFVVGANPQAPKDLVDYHNASHPLTLAGPLDPKIPYEKDVTYLNLNENMEEGKMPSWFKYANTLSAEHNFDFIAKVDSDTLLFPDRFLDYIASLPSNPRRIYGGRPLDSIACGGYGRPFCQQLLGANYMSGELYFMSADLSKYITSPTLNRQAIHVGIEDMCTGNYVHSYPKPILEAVVSQQHGLWEHGTHLKDPTEYEQRWKRVGAPNLHMRGSLSSIILSASRKLSEKVELREW